MSSPTNEQLDAINKTGKNIIVSAGAGSGKTFVLKERVLKKVSEGTNIDDLIILTFTNNAAAEMKERIRNILVKNNIEDAKYVDSAYITTFDSFAGSLVRKYNYLLGVSKRFNIIDSSIVETELKNILDNILEDKYKEKSDRFVNFITTLCYKDDSNLRKDIINLYNSLTNLIDKNNFLDTYIDKYYNDNYIEDKLNEYENSLISKLRELVELYELATNEALKEEVITYNRDIIEKLSSISTIDEIVDIYPSLTIKGNTGGKNNKSYSDNYKPIKVEIDAFTNSFKENIYYTRRELKNQYLSTKNNVIELIDILKRLDNQITTFKDEHNSYEFSDIALKAIELVKNHEDVREEIKNKTKEIMIDEYQDTNDIQEEFISYIANNNVYMVGDVKQSIYGFRNANPYLFKSKYDKYASNQDGYKIDLTANFRSRSEVINNINNIFSKIMFDSVGGANYKATHQMKFGKTSYNDLANKNINYNLDLYNYTYEKEKHGDYTTDEIEAFIIAEDIKNKMDSNLTSVHEIKDKDTSVPAQYKDFCILVDKSSNFELLKSILESNGIPASIDKDLSIKEDDEIYILKNLITLLINIHNNTFDIPFKHAFMSIGRSYLYRMSDQDLFDAIKYKKWNNTKLYKILDNISKDIDSLSNKEILYKLVNDFDFINKMITVGSIDERIAKLEYFINECDSLNKFGMDIYTMEDFFNNLLDSDEDIKMGKSTSDKDAVKIMTIHGSKGLEFNYVYLPYLSSQFKRRDAGDLILSKSLGLIIPFYDDGIDKTFIYKLNKQDALKEDISERIRLLYVAITRAKEKFTIISEFNDKLINDGNIDDYDLLKCKSYKDIITLLKSDLSSYTTVLNLDDYNLNKDYQSIKEYNYKNVIEKCNDKIIINSLNIDNKVLESKHFSKALSSLIDNDLRNILDIGTDAHAIFESYNFNKNNIDDFEENDKIYINNFLKHNEVSNISNAKVYKEHEIRFNKDDSTYHGFIDLLLEYDDHFDIIDYKFSNIDSEEYVNQLNGYKSYIEDTYRKPCNCYLYSIKNDIFKKI